MKPTPPHPTYLSERVASFAAVPSRGWSVHRHQRVFPGAGTFGVLLGWSLLHPAVQAQRSLAQTPTEQTASNESAKESAQAQPAANTNPDPNDPGSTDVGASAYQARAVAHPGPIALHGLDPSASGTEVPAATDVAMATTSEVLRQTPGSHVVAVGGMGSGSRLALRGAQFGHTVYMLGDLPLTGPDTGPLDLSLLPLEAFESLEVFRGGAPAWLLSPSIGGVVRLKPRRDYRDYLMLETGWGSFGTHRSSASAVVWSNRTMVVSSVGAYGSQNDYPIHYDNGTVFDPSDDESRRRQNAQVLGGHGLFHSRSELESGGTLEIALLALSRQGGAPGPSAIYARHSRRNETQGIGSASLIQPFGRGHRVGLLWGGGHQRRQFIDRFGEIGLGREISDDRISAMHLRSSLELSVAEYLEITTLLAVRRDRYLPDNALGTPQQDSDRATMRGAVEFNLHGEALRTYWTLRPSIQVYGTRARIQGELLGTQTSRSDTLIEPVYRLGATATPLPFLSLVASISTGVRTPSVLELFGDRGALEANTDLNPERGRNLDFGAVFRKRGSLLEIQGEVRGFHSDLRNLIQYRQNSRGTAKAENLNHAETLGVEAGFSGTLHTAKHLLERVSVNGSATLMRATGDGARDLVWRPRQVAQAQATYHSGALGAVENLSITLHMRYRGSYYNDPANFVEVAAATWLDLSAALRFNCGVSFLGAARDLRDTRGQDFVGYPLPGRRFALTVQYRKEL